MAISKPRLILDTNLWISFLLTKNSTKLDTLLATAETKLLFSQELLSLFRVSRLRGLASGFGAGGRGFLGGGARGGGGKGATTPRPPPEKTPPPPPPQKTTPNQKKKNTTTNEQRQN